MPHELQRITTTYVDVEDRLRLTGVLANGTVVQLWLTQRLLGRLVPPLTSWLVRNALLGAEHALPGAAPAAKVALADQEMVQGFAQQSAWAQLKPQPTLLYRLGCRLPEGRNNCRTLFKIRVVVEQ